MSIAVKPMALVIADISGYTRFTRYHGMALLHAEQIISDLLEAVIDAADHPLHVNKLEGDAVLFYAEAKSASRDDFAAVARDVAAQVARFFPAFKAMMNATMNNPVCWCSACQQVGELRLKVFLNFGEVALKQVKGFEELAGEPVIRLFRLTKNSIPADEYVLMTDEYHALAGSMAGMQMQARTEQCEGLGPVGVKVFTSADSAPLPAVPGAKIPFRRRLWQYLRVNGHAILRFFRLRPREDYKHIPH